MQVRDVMDQKVARVSAHETMQTAAELLVLTQASDLIVVDEVGLFVGVVSEGDLIRALIPDFDEVFAAGGTLADAFQIFVTNGQDLAQQSIQRLIIDNPITMAPDDEILKAATVMIDKMIRRLPVVEDGKFLGTISRADIAWAVLCRDRGKS